LEKYVRLCVADVDFLDKIISKLITPISDETRESDLKNTNT